VLADITLNFQGLCG